MRLWKTRPHKIGASSSSSRHHHHWLLGLLKVLCCLALSVSLSLILCASAHKMFFSPFFIAPLFMMCFKLTLNASSTHSIVSHHSSRHEIDHSIYMSESSGPIFWCFNNRSFRFILSFYCVIVMFSSIFLGICSPFSPHSNLQNKIKIYCILCVNASHLAGKMHIWIYQMHFSISVKYSSIYIHWIPNEWATYFNCVQPCLLSLLFFFYLFRHSYKCQPISMLPDFKRSWEKNQNEKRTWTRASGLGTRTS